MTRRLWAPIAAALVLLALPGSAVAAEFGLTAVGGVGPNNSVRDPNPKLSVIFAAERAREQRVTVGTVGPDNQLVNTPDQCLPTRTIASIGPSPIQYRGNGAYTTTVTRYAREDTRCATPLGTQQFAFQINATTPIAVPGPVLLTRDPGRTIPRMWDFTVGFAPNAINEVVYGRTLQLSPNGGYAQAEGKALTLTSQGKAQISFRTPGTYVIGAHAAGYNRFATPDNKVYSPWSTATVTVKAPFDIQRLRFSDRRGPSYRVVAYVGEASASGKVRVYLARGLKRGKYRRLGTVRIKRGQIAKRFRVRKPGKYRLKYTFAGTQTIAGGYSVQGIRVTRYRF